MNRFTLPCAARVVAAALPLFGTAAAGRRVGELTASRVLVTDPSRSAGQSAPIQTAGN